MVDKNRQLVIENLMRDDEGRKWVMNYLTSCGVFNDTFDENPITHAHSAGMRRAGLMLHDDVKLHAPALYVKMIQESIND